MRTSNSYLPSRNEGRDDKFKWQQQQQLDQLVPLAYRCLLLFLTNRLDTEIYTIMSTSPHQLFLLADHIKLSLLERQRAQSLNLPANNKNDGPITRSLESLRAGLATLSLQAEEQEEWVSQPISQSIQSRKRKKVVETDSSETVHQTWTLNSPNCANNTTNYLHNSMAILQQQRQQRRMTRL